MSSQYINQIITFWLGNSCEGPSIALNRKEFWYHGGKAVDDEIRSKFRCLIVQACNGELNKWAKEPKGALALVILMDQFTRNLYRNTVRAYSGDELALKTVKKSIDCNLDDSLHPVSRIWFYHPFHHSERLDDQYRGLELLGKIKKASPSRWHSYIDRSISGWTKHQAIVAEFGRFPHRNHVLGRTSTKREELFLESAGRSFGQGPNRINDP